MGNHSSSESQNYGSNNTSAEPSPMSKSKSRTTNASGPPDYLAKLAKSSEVKTSISYLSPDDAQNSDGSNTSAEPSPKCSGKSPRLNASEYLRKLTKSSEVKTPMSYLSPDDARNSDGSNTSAEPSPKCSGKSPRLNASEYFKKLAKSSEVKTTMSYLSPDDARNSDGSNTSAEPSPKCSGKSPRLNASEYFKKLAKSSSVKVMMSNLSPSDTQNSGNVTSAEPSPKCGSKSPRINSSRPPEFLRKLAKILVAKTLAEDNLHGISANVFLKYICQANHSLGRRLFSYFISKWDRDSVQTHGDEASGNLISKNAFILASIHVIELLSDADQVWFFIQVYANDKEKIDKNDVFDFIQAAYQTAKFAHRNNCLPDDIILAVVKATMHGKECVNTKFLHSWISQHCPRLVMWMHRYITHMITVGHRAIPLNADEKEDDTDTPILDHREESPCNTLHPALIWLLTCSLPTLYTKPQKNMNLPHSNSLLLDPHLFIERMISAVTPSHWVPLYNSDSHGTSLNRFQHHVFDYNGPTLVFITTEDGNLFCLACDEHWRDSKHFWGGEHCYCMQLIPEYKIVESGPKMMYFNITSRGFPTGIHVGQEYTNRALTLDLDLTKVTYRGIPYSLQSIEVWGCGTVEAKEAQVEMKKHEIRDTEKRKKINLNSVDWVDNPDRYLLELAGSRPNYAQYDKKTQGKQSTN
ncbi:uncharacterized protein [Palaemon carinicauda]|uniref:uncharacterized protein isoform X2 n=1 Tax=Palaemon carinicauda TaxID=392227 RepID=UPI0035B68EEF